MKPDPNDTPNTSRSKLAKIAERVTDENAVTVGRKLELYEEIGRRLAEIDGTRTWGRSCVYAVMYGKQTPGRRLAQAIDILHQNGVVQRPAPVCPSCGIVHLSRRCPEKNGDNRRRVRHRVELGSDLGPRIAARAAAAGMTSTDWVRDVLERKLWEEER